MLVVGLTGNIAGGKTAVARLIAARGVPVIDADVLAREAVAPGSPALGGIVARWGPAVLGADGALDRAALRRRVFGKPAELEALNAIVHPEVRRRREELVEAARRRGEPVVLCVIPLLFEAGLERDVDVVVLVDAPRPLRLDRLRRARGLTAPEAEAMVDAQLPAEAKRARADYVVDNADSMDALGARVDEVWRAIEARVRETPSA